MSALQGRRLPDCPVNAFPLPYDDLQPGDYWRCQHPTDGHVLDVRQNPDDRAFWGRPDDPRYAGNLTGGVWGVLDPLGHFGMLSIHTVREEDDGTISVRPGDGSSNSILIQRRADEPAWHGYIEHGVWSEC